MGVGPALFPPRGRIQRIDGGLDAELGDLPRQHRGGIQVGERRGQRPLTDEEVAVISKSPDTYVCKGCKGDNQPITQAQDWWLLMDAYATNRLIGKLRVD